MPCDENTHLWGDPPHEMEASFHSHTHELEVDLLPQSGLQLYRSGQYLDCNLKQTYTCTYSAK